MKIAAIDIGSNSIKLVVVDGAASDSFAVLAREKDMVRLGHETLRYGKLSPAAIESAIDCINRFRSIAEARGAERILAVATASVREASNASQFIKEVQKKAGVAVEVLSPIEEARLIGLAASAACAGSAKSILNIDIGGGSAAPGRRLFLTGQRPAAITTAVARAFWARAMRLSELRMY